VNNRDCISGVANCSHCGAHMNEFMLTNSGRQVYRCPDCGGKQFYDGDFVPNDLFLRMPSGEENK